MNTTLEYFSFFQNASDQYLGEVFFDIALFVNCGALIALIYGGFCSAFISAVWVAFPLLTKFCVHKDFKQHGTVFLVWIQMGKYLKTHKIRLLGTISFIFLGRFSKLLFCFVFNFQITQIFVSYLIPYPIFTFMNTC